MSGDHVSAAALTAGGRYKRPLALAFGLTATYMVVEAVGGIVFDSLALLSDAGHMLTDVVGIGLALSAIQLAQSRRGPSQTYGLYRLEVLAALANALLLFGVAAYILYEAYRRFTEPPDVPGLPLLLVATVGLLVNLGSFRLLQAGAKESLNVRGAMLEVLSDLLGSVGVIVAGIVLLSTGWTYVDPIVGAGIGLFILPRTWRLGREALEILLEVAPRDVDVQELQGRLGSVPGIAEVHDLHVWTLSSGLRAASGHLRLQPGAELGSTLRTATELLEDDFEIQHVTLQCEPDGFREPTKEV